jgi:serine/threonine-protein kinase
MINVRHFGKYESVDEIGRGGFAVVYRARDVDIGREVALKVITGSVAREQSFIERFNQKVRPAANLRHPRTVPIYDFGDDDGSLYLAMPLIGQGRTLGDLLAERGRLPLDEAIVLLAQLA